MNITKIINDIIGSDTQQIKLRKRVKWGNETIELKFDLQLLNANFVSHDGIGEIYLNFLIKNPKINDILDPNEFEYQFDSMDIKDIMREEVLIPKYRLAFFNIKSYVHIYPEYKYSKS